MRRPPRPTTIVPPSAPLPSLALVRGGAGKYIGETEKGSGTGAS